eukprot:CAMPEP_0206290666 /NCGR_PEP_ID=MMETSP0106_2-20121207/2734_1 /ASSEMBLY_ACC=CAM_ASM_000206 /TAXON_ID=81532 /ORGANISM="Acanthoeca-like sp., Strain 10tr" /LENGTH=167 /DNA_ID=CAMNT_0053721227 /DNA_START=174 /DNA_END=674 /DNA_ORIENTATION=+
MSPPPLPHEDAAGATGVSEQPDSVAKPSTQDEIDALLHIDINGVLGSSSGDDSDVHVHASVDVSDTVEIIISDDDSQPMVIAKDACQQAPLHQSVEKSHNNPGGASVEHCSQNVLLEESSDDDITRPGHRRPAARRVISSLESQSTEKRPIDRSVDAHPPGITDEES